MVANSDSWRGRTYRRWAGQWPWVVLGGVVLVALALWLWLLLGAGAGVPNSPAPPARVQVPASLTWQDLDRALVRSGLRPGSAHTVEAILATPQYYALTGRDAQHKLEAGPSVVFFLTENSHQELLPPMDPVLRIDGRTLLNPTAVELLADSPHHRMSVVRYGVQTSEGKPDIAAHEGHSGQAGHLSPAKPLVTGQTRGLELLLGPADGPAPDGSVLSWELPISYTSEYSSAQVVIGDKGPGPASPLTAGAAGLTWAAILAMLAGMLVALSPCLIQLGAYYTATLAGVSAEVGQLQGRASARGQVIYLALFFALGFTVVYTAGGAAAGYIGQSLQDLGLFNSWLRPLSIAAGVMVLIMAVRVAWNSRAPLVCHLPLKPLFGARQRTGKLGSALMGFTFAGGCLTCFSASVLPALLLYAGATGSVFSGALLLLVFSLGISVPCVLLALGVSRFQPLLLQHQRLAPALGLAGALVMAGFGVIMLSGQFHLVSGLIYRMLSQS